MRRKLSVLAFCALLLNWQTSYADSKSVPITATSWLVADANGKVIQGSNTQEQRSIASITKLMTVMVVLDAHQDLDETINGFTRRQLIQLALVRSDNHAAEALCDNYPNGRVACISAMNAKARFLNLPNTHYIEPTGLSIMNVSTAEELVTIVRDASTYPEIVECAKISQGHFKKKKRIFTFHNTNPLIATHDFIVSKTGFTNAAGGCIVMMLETKIGRRIIVLLHSKNTHTRIPEAVLLSSIN